MTLTRLHAAAGGLAFLTILTFWLSTAITEAFGAPTAIAWVKTAVLWGMIVLIPCLIATGASGMRLGRGRGEPRVSAKRRRMPFIAANGLVVLVPSAVYLAHKAGAGAFDASFVAVQALELLGGAVNIVLMGLNIRDGFALRAGPTPAKA